MHMNEFIIKSTVLIESCKNNIPLGTGTGFFLRLLEKDSMTIIGLATNKHVIEGADAFRILLTVSDSTGDTHIRGVEIPLDLESIFYHSSDDIDACAINVSGMWKEFEDQGLQILHTIINKNLLADENVFSELLPLEEVTMIGYPIGLMDSFNNGAIARRGVIASDPAKNYENHPEFLIDMACMPGSSGSPVFLANDGSFSKKNGDLAFGKRLYLLGLLWGGPERTVAGEIVAVPAPMNSKPIAVTQIPINLGFVIKSTELTDLCNQAEEAYDQYNETPA